MLISKGAFIGDSIAVGLSQVHPGYTTIAKVGRSPQQIAAATPSIVADWAVISSGTNNQPGDPIGNPLRRTRRKLSGSRCIWVLPANRSNAAQVRAIAEEFGDKTVEIGATAHDGMHPKSYHALWRKVTQELP